MYEDGNWYASHTLQVIGVALIAVALVALARSGALASSRQAQRAGVVAAVGAVGWAFGSFLHLIAATEADRIAADRSTPLTDALVVVETITVPVFCLGLVLLAVVGLRTGHVGNRTAAACARSSAGWPTRSPGRPSPSPMRSTPSSRSRASSACGPS
jgi:hypothetical protein